MVYTKINNEVIEVPSWLFIKVFALAGIPWAIQQTKTDSYRSMVMGDPYRNELFKLIEIKGKTK